MTKPLRRGRPGGPFVGGHLGSSFHVFPVARTVLSRFFVLPLTGYPRAAFVRPYVEAIEHWQLPSLGYDRTYHHTPKAGLTRETSPDRLEKAGLSPVQQPHITALMCGLLGEHNDSLMSSCRRFVDGTGMGHTVGWAGSYKVTRSDRWSCVVRLTPRRREGLCFDS